ncbi:putative nucleolar pre-ribosomal-associated protein [Helianthus annuus]|nr:putative nucleolar pre-ribosomal-associated protein [Helianthus annuus]
METDQVMNPESKQIPNFSLKVSHEAKLRELLRNLTSIDLQLCAEASKEFMKLLRGEEGGELLRQYVLSSSNCSELLQAWNLRQSKPGLSYIMSLINVILSQKDGVYKLSDVARLPISRALDKFARLILEEKLGDVFKELNSKENKGKNAALLLMASIVRRGSGLASDVAKSFDFKLPNFLKLAEYDKRRKSGEMIKRKVSTRRSYVRFAMSFLEIGDPRLLRWVLQQKEMFSGVLRGLGSDEEETVAYVLSTLRDKVLVPESLVPVGLRSVLFGSVTLEQLINISGRDDGADSAEVAQKVLFTVCTDPSNGLMPDSKATPFPLKGNSTRLLGVMKKLKATEIEFHRDLLLAIVRGRPAFGSAYLDEFPYNLEDHTSWFAAVSLAANLIASVNAGLSFDFLDSQPGLPSLINSSDVQSIIKCIGPRPFNRIVMNKGLLHSESHIQHGTLRLVLEALKLLDSLFSALIQRSKSSRQIGCKWVSLKNDIQNEVQLLLPDHQVLLSLISSLNNRYKGDEKSSKRNADAAVLLEHSSRNKKLKTSDLNEETDILVGGISSSTNTNGRIQEEDDVSESDNLNDNSTLIIELWKSHENNNINIVAEDEELYFYTKLLDALKVYHRTIPSVLEGSFDFFKLLPNNALSLPTILQQSLLSLLVEHIGWSSKQDMRMRYPPLMYKHLMHFINLVVHSPVKDIKDQAYVLAQAAMLSSGAFDNNATEIGAWFLFLPGFTANNATERGGTVQNLSSVVISFFCDVVSTVGNNLFKYWDLVRSQIRQLETTKDVYPRFSPLFVCVLEKCLRLLGSDSGTFSLPEKSMISIYVSSTLIYLLQTQAEAGLLSSLIRLSLSERLKDINSDLCEWRPLKSLLLFSTSITDKGISMLSSVGRKTGIHDDSFVNLLNEVTSLAENEHDTGITMAFSSSMLCASPDVILQHFPAVISVSHKLNGVPFSILSSICFLERNFLNNVFKSWPEFSFAGLERIDWAPFYVLLPAVISIESPYLSESSKLQDLLLDKLSKEISNNFVCSFRHVFFWFHHIQSSYHNEPVEKYVQISEICFALIKSMLAHVSANHYAQEIAETIFCHPAVIGAVESPLSVNKELNANILDQPTDSFLQLAREGVQITDHHILLVLEIFSNQFSFNSDVNKGVTCLLRKLVLMLKNRFDKFVESKDSLHLIPTLFSFYTLIRFISPRELLELVNWMFCRINVKESSVLESYKVSTLSVGLNIAGFAFDFLLPFSGIQEFDVALFEKVYIHIVKIASDYDLVVADLCLLKAVKIASKFKGESQTLQSLLNHMAMTRVIASTPVSLLSNCFEKTSMVRTQISFHLTESSLLHLSFFGYRFMKIVNESEVRKCDEDLMILLLPTALSFLNLISMRYGEKCDKHVKNIRSSYWEMLYNGFSNWKNFVSRDIFQIKLDKYALSTLEEVFDLFNNSLLGKSLDVMKLHLASNGPVKRSKRLKLVDSVIPSGTDNILECSASEIDRYSIDESLNLIMKAVTKVLLCKMMLFSSSEGISNKEYVRSVTFVNSLTSTWILIVRKFPIKSNSQSEVKDTKYSLFRLFESFILRTHVEVITEMHKKNSKTESNSSINLEQMVRSCLLHRFEDPATLNMFRNILAYEEKDKSLHVQILQLLLSHSQFESTIQSAYNSSSSLQFGIIFRPMSSILRSLTFAKVNKSLTSELYNKQLEIIKLLGLLCRFRAQTGSIDLEEDSSINARELVFLLLSSYEATVSEKDLEIYKIIQELESVDELNSSYIADVDFLWGTAAARVRKVRKREQEFSVDDVDEREKRRSQFRENLPVDPRKCAATALHFPYDRHMKSGALSSCKLSDDSAGNVSEIYDPAFILRMSLHGLSMNYIEPVEYASLGLLAVAFVSLSSPDDDIRKIGYKVLVEFSEKASKISQKKKEVNRLRSLLTHVQNGIPEAWQRIPSVHALFAAEASVLLLDPSNDNYKSISKILLHSPMKTKTISFFDEFFWSNSVNFKSERIWILRLLYSGLNLEDDAQIYVRSSIFEKLLSFYSSPLSDNESRELILQIVKKSMKFDKTSRYLIEHCGVISWLSSLISTFSGSTSQLAVILEVINNVVTSRNTSQWLEARSLEQLTQISCRLYVLFVENIELVKEIHLFDSVLELVSSTLEISQKRDVLQPHFTFSVEGLFELSKAVDVNCNAELGLKVVLMSTPQPALLTMDREKLKKFVLWMVCVALRSKGSDEQTAESLISKLLRWLTSSVILAIPSQQSFPDTLQTFLEAERSVNRVASDSDELLAAAIYYLHQILGEKCGVFTSVASSLCLLLFSDPSHTDALPVEGGNLTSLLSRIRCPTEADHLWRWSFEEPWKDPATASCSVDEVQACQSVLMVVLKVLGSKSSLSHFLSDLDLEKSGVFQWERSLVEESM